MSRIRKPLTPEQRLAKQERDRRYRERKREAGKSAAKKPCKKGGAKSVKGIVVDGIHLEKSALLKAAVLTFVKRVLAIYGDVANECRDSNCVSDRRMKPGRGGGKK